MDYPERFGRSMIIWLQKQDLEHYRLMHRILEIYRILGANDVDEWLLYECQWKHGKRR